MASKQTASGQLVRLRERGRRRAVELFAGVGGFRLGLEGADWKVVWTNQWEPSTRVQHASNCYVERFGPEGHVCDDISKLMDAVDRGEYALPEHDLLVGGFPCQDYSVARTLNQAAGLEGRKGVLWWAIQRALKRYQPRFIFLDNVDRLLKSPARQRGRDFAIILWSLSELGYRVEWRVVNAADYGFPQRRRRVRPSESGRTKVLTTRWAGWNRTASSPARCQSRLPPKFPASASTPHRSILHRDLVEVSDRFGLGEKVTPFGNAGVMWDRQGLDPPRRVGLPGPPHESGRHPPAGR